jgi:ribosomal protein S16
MPHVPRRGEEAPVSIYRIVIADSRSRRDGRFIEVVGTPTRC